VTNHPETCGPCEDCQQFAKQYRFDLRQLGAPEEIPEKSADSAREASPRHSDAI